MTIETNNIISEDLDFISQSSLDWEKLLNNIIMVTGGGGFIRS